MHRLRVLRGGAWFPQGPRSQRPVKSGFVHSFCWQSLEDYWLGISCSSVFHTCRELLCTGIVQFSSSSDIPELWLLMCLGKHFSSGRSWCFYLDCPADAIFLFIFLGMVSYVQLKNNSSPLPPFLLYIQKTFLPKPHSWVLESLSSLCRCAFSSFSRHWYHFSRPELIRELLGCSWDTLTLWATSPSSLPALAGRPWVSTEECAPVTEWRHCLLMFLTLESLIV